MSQAEQETVDLAAALAARFQGGEVVLLSGYPGAGKDTQVRAHLADRPVIELDALRAELCV